MKIKDVSASFTTNNVEGTRDFYVKHLNAKVTFDCGWYVNLEYIQVLKYEFYYIHNSKFG